MAKEKLFRETPFNGYNRDDVLEYIAELDRKQANDRAADIQAKDTLAAELEQKTSEIEKLSGIIDSLNFAVEEKTNSANELAAEFEAYKEETEKKLAEESSQKTSAEAEAQEAKIKELTQRLTDAEAKASEQDEQLRGYIEKICLLQSAQNTGEGLKTKLEEAERSIKEKDEKIVFLQKGWEQYKRNYGKYLEIADSADKIVADAREEAAKLLAAAEEAAASAKDTAQKEKEAVIDNINGEIQLLIANAVKESGRIISSAEERAKLIKSNAAASANETKEKLLLLKNSVSGIMTNIDFAVMNIDGDKNEKNQADTVTDKADI